MTDRQWMGFVLGWVALTLYLYFLAAGRRRTVTSQEILDGDYDCLGFGRHLITSTFGERYWTWRGLSITSMLSWGNAALLLLLGNYRGFGTSGYPAIEFLVSAALLLLPIWVHAIIHATRRYLDFTDGRHVNRKLWAILLPLVPAISLAASLIPIAIFSGMVDAESIVPQDVEGVWISLLDMAFRTWWSPQATGGFPIIFVPIGMPAIACCLYMISFASWNLIHILGRPRGLRACFPACRQSLDVGAINAALVLLYGLVPLTK